MLPSTVPRPSPKNNTPHLAFPRQVLPLSTGYDLALASIPFAPFAMQELPTADPSDMVLNVIPFNVLLAKFFSSVGACLLPYIDACNVATARSSFPVALPRDSPTKQCRLVYSLHIHCFPVAASPLPPRRFRQYCCRCTVICGPAACSLKVHDSTVVPIAVVFYQNRCRLLASSMPAFLLLCNLFACAVPFPAPAYTIPEPVRVSLQVLCSKSGVALSLTTVPPMTFREQVLLLAPLLASPRYSIPHMELPLQRLPSSSGCA